MGAERKRAIRAKWGKGALGKKSPNWTDGEIVIQRFPGHESEPDESNAIDSRHLENGKMDLKE